MKKLLIIASMLLTSSVAFADVTAIGQAAADVGVNASNGGVSIDSHAVGSDLGNAVGQAIAPSLTTTLTETCMGSTSVGGGFSGGSFSFGTTWRDSACVRRLDARQIQSMGDVQAAKEIMCDSDLVRSAFQRVGRPCAEDGGSYTTVTKAPEAAPAPAVEAPATDAQVTDEQDVQAKRYNEILEKADKARAEMKERHGW